MISWVRRRFSYANVAMTLALVFAMSGGAYAASKIVITSTKQISPKVLKSLKGANGKAGPAGPAGPAGAPGAKGETGAAGTNGTNGATGSNGSNGTSVTSAESKTKIGPCAAGGSEFKSASGTSYACNGEKGAAGKNGTFGGEPLPQGETLRGAYAASSFGSAGLSNPGTGTGIISTAVTFADPVFPEIKENVHYIGLEEGAGEPNEAQSIKNGECKGNESNPGAAEGQLCVFGLEESNVAAQPHVNVAVAGTGSGASNSDESVGFTVVDFAAAAGTLAIEGSWAVTGG